MLFDSFEAYDVQETRRISREEGRRETLLQINQLIQRLILEKRYDDLERAAKDPEYQEQLLKELGL